MVNIFIALFPRKQIPLDISPETTCTPCQTSKLLKRDATRSLSIDGRIAVTPSRFTRGGAAMPFVPDVAIHIDRPGVTTRQTTSARIYANAL